MKKMKYESPEMEIIRFDTQDIITTIDPDTLPNIKP